MNYLAQWNLPPSCTGPRVCCSPMSICGAFVVILDNLLTSSLALRINVDHSVSLGSSSNPDLTFSVLLFLTTGLLASRPIYSVIQLTWRLRTVILVSSSVIHCWMRLAICVLLYRWEPYELQRFRKFLRDIGCVISEWMTSRNEKEEEKSNWFKAPIKVQIKKNIIVVTGKCERNSEHSERK